MRIIGVELRMQFHDPRTGPQQREFAIVPCDIEIHMERPKDSGYYVGQHTISGTLHTDCGDLGFNLQVPDSYVDENYTKTRMKANQKL